MDTLNQTSAPATTDLLRQWWDSKSFEGKEFCHLAEDGSLSLKSAPDRVLTTLNAVTGDAVVQSLIDKYKELARQCQELAKEWEETTDKIKCMNKVSRAKEHLQHVQAIGDLDVLSQQVKAYEQEIDRMIDANYREKQALVAEAESLNVENNNWKDITQKFKDLTEKWKGLGFVDKKRNEELWDRLEAIKNKFFEDKRSHQEDIEKEMLQNLDLKMELVEKAEAHAHSEHWKETTEVFKTLLEEWKTIGRTLPEKNEALWQRFIAAKNNFFDRKKLHTDQIKVEQESNMAKKLALIEKAETIKESRDWAITAKAFNELMDQWKAIGPVPSEHSNTLWDRFSSAKEQFFSAKRNQADAYKQMLEENYARKKSLIEKAEALKNSTNWRDASDEMNRLFDEWKQIGHVGKEHSEVLWEKFISARKHFFNRKDQDRERRKQQYEKNKEIQNIQTRNFLNTLMNETEDDRAQILEFRENLEHITEGPKAEELRAHLTNLIGEIEQRIQARESKIAELRAQVARQEQHDETNAQDQQKS